MYTTPVFSPIFSLTNVGDLQNWQSDLGVKARKVDLISLKLPRSEDLKVSKCSLHSAQQSEVSVCLFVFSPRELPIMTEVSSP